MSRRAPRSLASALDALADKLAPASDLARVQSVWAQAVGPEVAAAAHPRALRDGVLTVACEAAVWAQELDLMGAELATRVNAALGAQTVRALRCRTA